MHRVVIVDDEPAARRGLRHHLEAFPDIEIAGEAGNVESALELIQATKPEAVFLDVEMPGADGFEAASHLSPDIKLIFVTAHSRHAHRAFEVEALDYVLKPLHPRRIAQVVDRLRRTRGESRAVLSTLVDGVESTKPDAEELNAQASSVLEDPVRRPPWVPPSPEDLAAVLPQFEITKLIGRGGMGAVYEGLQRGLERPVAIKILPTDAHRGDNAFVARFRTEARAMARLKHPGIITVHDVGETSRGMLYIVMELVDGIDVRRMIEQRGRLAPAEAFTITAHVCDALASAHQRGVIHRDIKPANIMIDADGTVKVADFGLAKVTREGQPLATATGAPMGTHHYSAPELLARNSVVDQRADIYAVGVMLYQMLTGRLPQGVFDMPSVQIPGLDPRCDDIVVKALRQDPELRYHQVQDLHQDLKALMTRPVALGRGLKKKPSPSVFHLSPEHSAMPIPASWRRWLAAALVLALISILAALRPRSDKQTVAPAGVIGRNQ